MANNYSQTLNTLQAKTAQLSALTFALGTWQPTTEPGDTQELLIWLASDLAEDINSLAVSLPMVMHEHQPHGGVSHFD